MYYAFMSTKIDQIGWVNLKLANKGYIDRSNEDEVAANDEAKLVFDLGKFSKEVHTDLSASLEYDLCAKAAAVNVGFLNDVGLAEKNPEDDGKPPAGVRAQLKTSIPVGDSLGLDDFANAEHKLKLYYLHESVGDIGVEFHPGKALDGKVEVSRDAYKLSVPFSKDGVDKDKITFEKSRMMDFVVRSPARRARHGGNRGEQRADKKGRRRRQKGRDQSRSGGSPMQDHAMHRRAEGREAHDKEDEGGRTGRPGEARG